MATDYIITVFIPQQITQLENCSGKFLLGHHTVGQERTQNKRAHQHTVVLSAVLGSVTEWMTNKCLQDSSSLLGFIAEEGQLKPSPQHANLIKRNCIWIKINPNTPSLIAYVILRNEFVDLACVHAIIYTPEDIWNSHLLLLMYPLMNDCSEVDPVSYLISKLNQNYQPTHQSHQTSKYILYQISQFIVLLLQTVFSLPKLSMHVQSVLEKVLGCRSATLEQVNVRVMQLQEIKQLLPCLLQGTSWITKEQTLSIANATYNKFCNDCDAVCDKSKAVSLCPYFIRKTDFCVKQEVDVNNPDIPNSEPCRVCKVTRSVPVYSPSLVLGRLVFAVAFDFLLGMLLLSAFCHFVPEDDLYSAFRNVAQSVSHTVLRLLAWLRGAPAGLKLNQPLTRALAAFFSYHVGLWMLYLEVCGWAVKILCVALVWGGLLGASLQLALLSDLVQLATLHLHCFYVYAARLHMVQVSLLGSQWRAFRGRKWNPLKRRVDSLLPAAPPLSRVLTAVVFTLGVFLLPTTATYYVVFLTLRLCLVTCGGALSLLARALHHNPLYVLALHGLLSRQINGSVDITAVSVSAGPQLLRLTVRPAPLSISLRASAAPTITVTPEPRPATLLNTVLYARHLL